MILKLCVKVSTPFLGEIDEKHAALKKNLGKKKRRPIKVFPSLR